MRSRGCMMTFGQRVLREDRHVFVAAAREANQDPRARIFRGPTFDKQLSKKNLSKQKLGREKWLKMAWDFKDEVYKSVSKTWRFMGLSADWSREVFTLDEGPRQAVFQEFKTYYERGLIYKGPYIVEWCPKCNTAIEDAEMEYEERKEKLYYVKYHVKQETGNKKLETKEFITVATTRPETIFADTAVAVYPKHLKYKKTVGKKRTSHLKV